MVELLYHLLRVYEFNIKISVCEQGPERSSEITKTGHTTTMLLLSERFRNLS